jgi:hypothetical protein
VPFDASRQLLRHTIATLAYRGAKVVRGAPGDFAEFTVSATTRTPGAILAHIGDLLDWALTAADGRPEWRETPPASWDADAERFFAAVARLDARLADPARLGVSAERLFQGPVADALSHVGQIAMLRRLAGAPVRGENYFVAGIATGVVGQHQPPPVREFD